MQLVPTASAHVTGTSEVIQNGHDHAVQQQDAPSPLLIAAVVIPCSMLMFGMMIAIVWVAIKSIATKHAHT